MAKREFIRREDLKELDHYTVDNGKYVGMKLGDVFDDLVISEQDIVKPYLKKLLNKVKNHAVEFELFGISDDYISIGILQGIIIRLLSEQGDTE